MAADINGNRQPRNMRGRLFYIYGKCGYIAAEALRTDTELIYFRQNFLLELCVKFIGIAYRNIAAKRFFCE